MISPVIKKTIKNVMDNFAKEDSADNDNDVENRNLKPTKELSQVREKFPDETSNPFSFTKRVGTGN